MNRERVRWGLGVVVALAIAGTGAGLAATGQKGRAGGEGRWTGTRDGAVEELTAGLVRLPGQTAGGEAEAADRPIFAVRDGKIAIFVELDRPAAARAWAATIKQYGGPSLHALAAARSASANQAAAVMADQELLGARLEREFGGEELFRAVKAVNGIATFVDPARIEAIRRLPGVKSVREMPLEYPTNSTSVPFIGAPQLWGNEIGLGRNLTGAGIRIGIIDSGIDYLHADFGGPGTLAAYQDNSSNPGSYFPTAKVVGGTDFVGDAYTGSNSPAPDPYPMDCGGHGSHVSGTVAGFGVNADGSTFTGPYSSAAAFSSLRIGPGVAPGALLYALRVFGCGGSTLMTVPAIEWSMDPNGDLDFSDHLDVINMSLGSSFGSAESSSAMASDAAAEVGVIVVASAGNAGDTFFITGSPGVSARTVSTAAVLDPGSLDGSPQLSVNLPAAIAGNYVAGYAAFGPALTPNGVTGNVVQALDPADGSGPLTTDGCSALTNGGAVSGNIALIDRGTCGFAIKVKNAQNAGAIGVIIANNTTGIVNMSGVDATITIPSLSVSQSDGNLLKGQLAVPTTVNATLHTGSFPSFADTVASFSSRGPRRASSPILLKPDIAAPGYNITSVQTGNTCVSGGCITPNATGYIPDNQSLVLSGTSMAAPHMTGVMALLKQEHPGWTVEELKALAMNEARHDVFTGASSTPPRYSPSRIGAGRVDTVYAGGDTVVAFNADDSGSVSVSFGTEVVGSASITRTVRVVNHGATPVTYDLALDMVTSAPGVNVNIPPAVTVPGDASTTFDIVMTADATQMKHAMDPTLATSQVAGTLSARYRHWLTEHAGYLTFSVGGQQRLRLPIYSAPVPASSMAAAPTIATGGNATGSVNLALSGTGVCTATLGAGTCTGTSFPSDEVSMVTPFELQVVSPRDTDLPGYLDLQYAGISFDSSNGIVLFGVSTWGDWSSPTDVTFNIYIDTNNDGVAEKVLFNSNIGSMASALFGVSGAYAQDNFVNAVFTPPGSISYGNYVNALNPASNPDTRMFNNNVMFLYATLAQLGNPAATSLRYWVQTCPGSAPLCQSFNGFHYDEAGSSGTPFYWDRAAQGLNFSSGWLFYDLPGATIPVAWNTANVATNASQGALLLHHHNAQGTRAQIVLLEGASAADLAVGYGFAPGSPTVGQNVTLTISVTNNGPSAASGVVVTDILPMGLDYVSDDGGGGYDSNTGQWTIGALGVSSTATLHVIATVNTTAQLISQAQVTSSTPLDPNLANNQASVVINAPEQADLSITKALTSPPGPVTWDVITYEITVSNAGPNPAYNVVVTDQLPANLEFVGSSATSGTYDPGTGLWTIPSIGNGGSEVLTIDARIVTYGTIVNSASVTSGTADPAAGNNVASATTAMGQAIPTLSGVGLGLLILAFAALGLAALRRSFVA